MVGISLLVVGWGKSWSPHGGPAHQAKSDCRPHGWLSGPVCRESGRVQAPKKCKCEPPRIVLAPSPVPQTHTQSCRSSTRLPLLQAAHPPAGAPARCMRWGWSCLPARGDPWCPAPIPASFLSWAGSVFSFHHPADVEAAALWINLTVI